jgi:dihydroneopterin aldolase
VVSKTYDIMATSYIAPMRTSWEVAAAAGQPCAIVRVRNLQAVIPAAQDAWGRVGKSQPILVSAEVSLLQPFETAATTDKVSGDTVHYGTLTKAILASLEVVKPHTSCSVDSPGEENWPTLRNVLDAVWLKLTGLRVDGLPGEEDSGEPFLQLARLRFLSVTVFLPKASLLGDGVSLKATSMFTTQGSKSTVGMFSVCLGLQNLRMPTMIGVNSNERLCKQLVVTTVEIEKYDYLSDGHNNLESLVVKVTMISCKLQFPC